MSIDPAELGAPDAVYVRQRFIPVHRVDYAKQAQAIMLEHGAVDGTRVYESRHKARWAAQYLIRLLVELRLFHRKELSEHVGRRRGGWVWTVEYIPGGKRDGS